MVLSSFLMADVVLFVIGSFYDSILLHLLASRIRFCRLRDRTRDRVKEDFKKGARLGVEIVVSGFM